MSDINGRRGKILGTEPTDGYQDVKAIVPESEMLRFALDMRSITQGRGRFAQMFSPYEEMPAHLAEGIIEEFPKQHEAAASAHEHRLRDGRYAVGRSRHRRL